MEAGVIPRVGSTCLELRDQAGAKIEGGPTGKLRSVVFEILGKAASGTVEPERRLLSSASLCS